MLAQEEVGERRVASLSATRRVIVLLSTMKDDPELRRAVQVTLGAQGRARLEQALLEALQSVPDLEERTRALRLWAQLEAAAAEQR
jgi:hypothetical protein